MPRPYERLWRLIESCQPDAAAFRSAARELGAEELVKLYADAVDARAEVRESWDGPVVPEAGGALSEDSTEDLCDWIVGQGHAAWDAARGADDAALVAHFRAMYAERDAGGRWSGRTPAIGPSFYAAYAERFDADAFLDEVERELDSRS